MSMSLESSGEGAPYAVVPDGSVSPRAAEGAGRHGPAWPAPPEDDMRIEGNVYAVADIARREPSADARVAIYARYGVGRQGRTRYDQRDACRRAALGLAGGFLGHVTSTDDGVGHAAAARAAVHAATRAGRSQVFDVVLVESPGRSFRDAGRFERIRAELDRPGIVVASARSGRLEKADVTLRGGLADAVRTARSRRD